MKNRAFSLAETLIALAVVAVVAVILIPAIKHFMPDQNQVLASKAYNILESGVKNIIENSGYSNNSQDQGQDMDHMATVGKTEDTNAYVQKGLANISSTGTSVPSGQNKFCYLLSQQMSAVSRSCTPDANSKTSFKTSNGMYWEIHTPSDAFKLRSDSDAYKTRVVFDVDGDSKGPNCGSGTYLSACASGAKPDRYEVGVRYDGRIVDSSDIGHSSTVNTCGEHGYTADSPRLSISDWKYHYYDAIQTDQDCTDQAYDCISCDSRGTPYYCGTSPAEYKAPENPNWWALTKDNKAGGTCTHCDICNSGSNPCGYAAGSKVGSDWVVNDAKSGDKCTPPSHALCASGYTVTVPGGQNKQGSKWVTVWDKDWHAGIEGYCTACDICNSGSNPCGYATGSKVGSDWVVNDAKSGDKCTPPSHAICASGYTETLNALNADGSLYVYTRDKDSKDPCTYCTVCSDCSYQAGYKSGTQWVVKDVKNTSKVCTPPSHAICASGYTEAVNALDTDGSTYIYTRDKDSKDTCTSCTVCSDCGYQTGYKSGTQWVVKDAKKTSQVCTPPSHTICASGYTETVNALNADGSLYIYTRDKDSKDNCTYCNVCSNCGTVAAPSEQCTAAMPSCYYYDKYSTSTKCATTYCNTSYTCGSSSAGKTGSTLNTTNWNWETKDNNTDACVASKYPGNICSSLACVSCDPTIGCGTHYSCDPTSHICNTYDNKNTSTACGTPTCDSGYVMSGGKCVPPCTSCSNDTANGGCGTTRTCATATIGLYNVYTSCTIKDNVTPSTVCSTYTNPCGAYLDKAAILNSLRTLSNSAAVTKFKTTYPLTANGHAGSDFSYSMISASPSSSDQLYNYFNAGSAGGVTDDQGAFGILLQSFSSDLAQAMASQSGSSLNASQFTNALTDAQKSMLNYTSISFATDCNGGVNLQSGKVGGCDYHHTYASDCSSENAMKGWFKFCRGGDDHSYTVDPSVVLGNLISNFQNYCTQNYDQIYAHRCEWGTHYSCRSTCDEECYYLDNLYNAVCTAAGPNPQYLGTCCNDSYCCGMSCKPMSCSGTSCTPTYGTCNGVCH